MIVNKYVVMKPKNLFEVTTESTLVRSTDLYCICTLGRSEFAQKSKGMLKTAR